MVHHSKELALTPTPTRRQLLASAAVAGVAAAMPNVLRGQATPAAPAPSRKLNLALVGVANQGFWHVKEIEKLANANVVALCDVDSGHLAAAGKVFPKAEGFRDYRELLKSRREVEAVLVATPDHTHAPITAAALRAGKHVYCEKPLTHTVREARTIAKLAAETKRCTQMGIQIHSMENYRRVVELIKAGAIGPVTEVHIWNARSNHPADATEVPVPATLDYDLWLGPVAFTPYRKSYHPKDWRRFWPFGTGLLGDIGCHLMDVAFWALDLTYPTVIECTGTPPPGPGQTPDVFEAHYEFPARGERPAVKMSWYDPPRRPPEHASWKLREALSKECVLFVGKEGMLATNYGAHALLPEDKFKDYQRPAKSIPPSPGHQAEWVNACLANDPSATSTPFTYGALLTETALLGTVAYRAGKRLEWDAKAMRFTNAPEAEAMLGYEHRKGWEV